MRAKLTINSRAFAKEAKASLAKNNKAAIEKSLRLNTGELVSSKIQKMKKEMISEFLSLPITREIIGGATASNSSGTLGGYGNLFSFIGFDSGSNPIDPIVKLLNQTTYNFSNLSSRGVMKLTITLPSAKDIFGVTPLPWAPGISWSQRMEVGLSGLGQYLDKHSDKSRSGAGVQTKNKIRSGTFRNSPYISAFVKKWSQKFLKIEKSFT